ncbi:hypothetical protein AOXY_G9123 [Acipenser oxyrinchus oxyrinchus]|uniref:Uncharacterized protein n=1 Tax=Acipenser oxyrinchus oxyrinchus TaxID=40147 RepID=A0AAD8DFE4_ACIOX|nr:hypothetical protein AOXY_G9123 [Acipenser oxyrinchus oxyrinchus]
MEVSDREASLSTVPPWGGGPRSRNAVVRPKSAKGRRRSSLQIQSAGYGAPDPPPSLQTSRARRSSQDSDGHSYSEPPPHPTDPEACQGSYLWQSRNLRTGSSQEQGQTCRGHGRSGTPSAPVDFEPFVLPRTTPALNKYKVLPSIRQEGRALTLNHKGGAEEQRTGGRALTLNHEEGQRNRGQEAEPLP